MQSVPIQAQRIQSVHGRILVASVRYGVVLASILLASCGSSKRGELCVNETNRRLEGQVFRLDEKALHASEQAGADETLVFRGSVVLKPGTSSEITQTIECVVATNAEGVPDRVLNFRFDWSGVASNKLPPG
jgi:hypothetical protein